MEQPTKETTVKSEVPINDQNPKPPHSADLKPVDQVGTKGAEDASSVISLSDESTLQVEVETKGDQAPTRTASGSRKSVHWNPELVSESPAPDQKAVSSSSSAGSNPYVARAPAETSDASLKGTVFKTVSVSFWFMPRRCVTVVKISFENWSRNDGICERCAWKMGKEGWRSSNEGREPCR